MLYEVITWENLNVRSFLFQDGENPIFLFGKKVDDSTNRFQRTFHVEHFCRLKKTAFQTDFSKRFT